MLKRALFTALAAAATLAFAASAHAAYLNMGTSNTSNATTTLTGTTPGSELLVRNAYGSASTAYALYGLLTPTSPSGNAPAIRGHNSSTNAHGFGVMGTQAGSGTGVYGYTPSGTGVWGNTSSGTGAKGSSTSGIGVLGQHTATSGAAPGVQGATSSTNPNAAGVYGLVSSASAGANSAGVIGMNNDASFGGYGVYGSSGSYGVYGVSPDYFAVWGESTYGVGVTGHTSSGTGVSGSSTSGDGVYGSSSSHNGVRAQSTSSDAISATSDSTYASGIYAENIASTGNKYAAYLYGNLFITGGKCTGCAGPSVLQIDDPLDPAHKYLEHSSVASSQQLDVYSGNVTTNGKGFATVTMPNWFEALNRSFRYQLTVVGKAHWDARAAVWNELKDNRFMIRTDQPNVKVSWLVTAVRHDSYANANPTHVIVEKPKADQGKYVHPELYGKPRSDGIGYQKPPRMRTNARGTHRTR